MLVLSRGCVFCFSFHSIRACRRSVLLEICALIQRLLESCVLIQASGYVVAV